MAVAFGISRGLLSRLSAAQRKRLEAMKRLVEALKDSPLVLKGGSALMFFYEGDRFSEDLDFDALVPPERLPLRAFIERHWGGIPEAEVRIAKDTATTKRTKVLYPDFSIRVEISFRRKELYAGRALPGYIQDFGGVKVYTVDELARLKLEALTQRKVGRDIYDLASIMDRWMAELSEETLEELKGVFVEGSLEELLQEVEADFKRDQKLGDGAFYLTYGRLLQARNRLLPADPLRPLVEDLSP